MYNLVVWWGNIEILLSKIAYYRNAWLWLVHICVLLPGKAPGSSALGFWHIWDVLFILDVTIWLCVLISPTDASRVCSEWCLWTSTMFNGCCGCCRHECILTLLLFSWHLCSDLYCVMCDAQNAMHSDLCQHLLCLYMETIGFETLLTKLAYWYWHNADKGNGCAHHICLVIHSHNAD